MKLLGVNKVDRNFYGNLLLRVNSMSYVPDMIFF